MNSIRTIGEIIRDTNRSMLVSLLNSRRTKQYRMGALQMAVLAGFIDNGHFNVIAKQIRAGDRKIVSPWD